MEGTRICFKDSLGAVRWTGSIQGKEGLWVGIEWDDKTKGKHSGSYEGVQYFVTKAPDSGSFLKEPAFLEGLKPGVSIEYAIFDKYADKNALDLTETYVPTVKNFKKPIELIGTEKIQKRQEQINNLKEVALQSCCVASINEGFGRHLISCEILLLDKNLLNSWNQVSQILIEIPQLHTLSLAGNLIEQPLTNPVSHALSILALNNMRLTMSSVIPIISQFPQLQELHLFKNFCNDLNVPIELLSNLKLLNLEDNNITSWQSISDQCKHLPCLDKIIINSNPIRHIQYDGGFENLSALSVENCDLNDWKSIEEMGKIPGKIKELRMARNQNLTETIRLSLFRFNAVARIGSLGMLNGSAVRSQERIEAERYFLRSNADNPDAPKLYRWEELIAKHGPPSEISCKVVSEQDSLSGQNLNKNTITIMIRSLARVSAGKEFKKKLLLSMNVGDLKSMCSKLFGVQTNEMKLSFRDKACIMPEFLDDNLKSIGYYIMSDDGEIWVEDLN